MNASSLRLAEPPARAQSAARLLRASERHSFDPAVDIDWDAPLADDLYFMPPHRSSLFGTPLWERLTEDRRRELTRHEVASIASVGIWFESVLMQMFIRHAYDLDPTTEHVQYALTEIGDECRHSVMFGRMIAKLGCPAYGPGRRAHALGRFFKSTSTGPLAFAAALLVEEMLDALQREVMVDPGVQPLVRTVSRIHVIEESRHMRFARDELAREWPRTSGPVRAYTRLALAIAASEATRRLVHPRVYAAVGLDVGEARSQARANPRWRETRAWGARKAVEDFETLGLIDATSRPIWKRAGLLP